MNLAWLAIVVSRRLELYSHPAAREGLRGRNAFLNDRQPWEVLASGRYGDVLNAIRLERADSYA